MEYNLPHSRKEALEVGAKYFFNGEPCPQNHVSKRVTKKSTCYECVCIASKKWRESHKERMYELVQKFKKKFRERDRKYLQEWRRENRESVRIHNAHYLIRKRNAEGFYKKSDIEDILNKQNYKCVSCNADLKISYHVDHIMPLILGGTNWPDNLQALCPSCNTSKKAMHPEQWKKEFQQVLT